MSFPVLLDDVAAAIVTAAIGTATAGDDWFVMKAYMADQPDRAICVYPRPGAAPDPSWSIDSPQFQVAVRGGEADINLVLSKLQNCIDLLHSGEVYLSATPNTYVYCYALHSGFIPLGPDEKARYRAAVNFRTERNTGL